VSEEAITAPPVEPSSEVPMWQLYFVGAALLLCFGQCLLWMFDRWWNDEYYGHGLLIPIISGYIVYRKWSAIKSLPREGFRLGLPVLIAGIALHIVATYWDVNFPSGFAFVISLFGAIVWLWGWPTARAAAFPIFYLCFAVPVARMLVDRFAQPLQIFSAQFGAAMSTAIGIPTVQEGTAVHIPEYTFEVAIVCSGLKSIIAMSALAALYAYMVDAPVWKRLLLLVAAVPVALFANGSRIGMTLILGRIFGKAAAEGFFHTASGLFVFLMALIGLFIVGALLKCTKIRADF
jgi:exosortase